MKSLFPSSMPPILRHWPLKKVGFQKVFHKKINRLILILSHYSFDTLILMILVQEDKLLIK